MVERSLLQPEIPGTPSADEELYWCGKPRQGIDLKFKDIFLIPFGILLIFLGVFLFSIISLWSILLVCVGFWLCFRFLIDAQIRAATVYAVTNKRVMLSTYFPFDKSLSMTEVQSYSVQEKPDGSGVVRFHSWSLGPEDTYNKSFSFEITENISEVKELIKEARKAFYEEINKEI